MNAEQVKALLLERMEGKSLRELSRELGMNPSDVSRFLRGKADTPPKTVLAGLGLVVEYRKA